MLKEVAKMRRNGEIVIPINIRKKLNLKEGEYLIVIPNNDSITLKKLKL